MKRLFKLFIGIICITWLWGCTRAAETDTDTEISNTETDEQHGLCDGDDSDKVRPAGWTKESHCKGEDPDYELLFDDKTVHRFDITISSENYNITMDDLDTLYSTPASPDALDTTEDPIYVPVKIEYNGLEWDNVAMRYKGNSSLRSSYQMGVKKFSFRLNFDKYEDDYPQIENQRFYGFKKMTFSNGFKDSSLLRDKVAGEMFRQGGVPVAMSSFARVYVDFGEGSTYFGLYTMIEDPSDEMIGVQFDDGSGNLYKPEGTGATWESFDEDSFEKKTNEESSDWSDIINAMNALHGDRADASVWRTNLETYFDTDAFLRCLAINQAMVNWDSYGTMNHNYYVYGNPADNGRLVWFPWDLNEAMLQRQTGPGSGSDYSDSVMLDEADDSWPLIRYLLDDDVYRDKYKTFLQNALDTSLDTDFVYNMLDEYHNLISPYVIGDNGESAPYTFLNSDNDFETSVSDDLKPHIAARRIAVSEELGL